MPSSVVCCLLPLVGVLLLGDPTHADGFGFQSRPPRPPPRPNLSSSIWQKQKDTLTRQVLQVQAHVLLHLNKKHNATFLMAPGETTHIMAQTVYGHIYNVKTILVNAECPDNYMDDLSGITSKDCKVQPDSKKMLCNLEVIELSGIDAFIIIGEDCHEYVPPSASPGNPGNSADSYGPPQQGEEENYYV